MRLTTRGRYAVTAMLDLALHGSDGPVTLADIAERQHISLAYLEQLFARLRRHGLVRSMRGPGGGYLLAGAGLQTSIVDIIDAVDESLDATRCGGGGDCQSGQICLTHALWSDLSGRIHAFLAEVTLEELVSRPDIRAVALRQRADLAMARDRIETAMLDAQS